MKNLKIFLIVISLFIVNQLSNAAPASVSCTITSYCNAVVKAKDKAVKKRLITDCIEYILYGYNNDWENEFSQPAQSGQGSKGGAGGSLPGLRGGAGGSGKSSSGKFNSRSVSGKDGADGKSYAGGVGGKGGAGGKSY